MTCDSFVSVQATEQFVGQHVAIYLDDTVPAGGYTPLEVDSIGELFDQYLYPIDTTAFGREPDIDGNGVVIALLTDQVNALSPSCAEIAAGYFFGLDLLDDPHSNRGEVFYSLVPNPSGPSCQVPKSFARRRLAPTFIHEFQHMISFSRHRLLAGGNAEESWLNEGLSLFAEELGGRLVPDPQCVGGQPNACATQFLTSNLGNAYLYLASTESYFLVEPQGSEGSLAERGANWLFVRWLADRSEADSVRGTDLTRALDGADSPGGIGAVGAANIEAAARGLFDPTVDFPALLGEWQLANYLEGVAGYTEPTGRLTYLTLNLPGLFNALVLGPYPLTPSIVTGPFEVSGTLRAGSGRHFRLVQAPNAPGFSLRLTTSQPTVLQPRFAVARVE
jgi:hypothetical protein